MRLKDLEKELQPLQGFATPKRELEQYVTSAHLASRMIFTAQSSFGDIEDKNVLDLGCGCAVLSIAAVMMGAESVMSVDIDSDALATAKENIAIVEMQDEITLLHAQISNQLTAPSTSNSTAEGEMGIPVFDFTNLSVAIDTVIMNPPFGSWIKGIDMVFLEVASKIAETAIYSLHKTSTRDFILKKASSFGFSGQVIAEMKYDLPKTMSFHKHKSVDIEVDLFRFHRIKPRK